MCVHLLPWHIMFSLHNYRILETSHCRKSLEALGGQPYPDWVIENKLTFSWDLCNSIRQELIESGKPHDFAAVKARVVQMMQSPSAVPSSVPPKQLQSFGTSLP